MVITPEALERSKSYRKATLADLLDRNSSHDESFVYIYPSNDLINEVNGDGDLIEIVDIARDNSYFDLADNSKIRTDAPNMQIYVR